MPGEYLSTPGFMGPKSMPESFVQSPVARESTPALNEAYQRAHELLFSMPMVRRWANPDFRVDGTKNRNLFRTAHHEICHGVAGLRTGSKPLYISVIPEGNSLGRTVFSSSFDNPAVLAAGNYATPDDGTGMDRYMVENYLSTSWTGAVQAANAILMQEDQNALHIASAITAGSGVVTDIAGLYDYAHIEVEWNQTMPISLWEAIRFVSSGSFEDPQSAVFEPTPVKDGWIHESLVNGDEQFTLILNGQEYSKQIKFGCCGGIDGHAESCQNNENHFYAPNLLPTLNNMETVAISTD